MKIGKTKPTKKQSIKREVIEFITERRKMVNDGFPYCYVENFVEMHCDTCIDLYRKKQSIHKTIKREVSKQVWYQFRQSCFAQCQTTSKVTVSPRNYSVRRWRCATIMVMKCDCLRCKNFRRRLVLKPCNYERNKSKRKKKYSSTNS